jgi:citrate lyase beta subunit
MEKTWQTMSKSTQAMEQVNDRIENLEAMLEVYDEVMTLISTAESVEDIEETLTFIQSRQAWMRGMDYTWLLNLVNQEVLPEFIEREHDQNVES